MANSNVKFVETSSSKLSSLPITEGMLIYTTDTFQLYRDDATERHLLTKGNNVKISPSEPKDFSVGDIWIILTPSDESQ